MSLINVLQGSPEWLELRKGNCTGSRVKDALDILTRGPGKGQSSAKRRRYMVDLISERLSGFAAEHFVTPAMEWGLETEQFAREAYQIATDSTVTPVGIAQHDHIERFMASPDGLVGDVGVVEFKCPVTANHIQWMLEGVVPEEHIEQCYAELACTGREWLDFVSFDPRLPLRHQLFTVRLLRNEEAIETIEGGVIQFLSETDAMLEQMNALNPEVEAAQKIQEVVDEMGITSEDIADWYASHGMEAK